MNVVMQASNSEVGDVVIFTNGSRILSRKKKKKKNPLLRFRIYIVPGVCTYSKCNVLILS